jgi:hypothetical protein
MTVQEAEQAGIKFEIELLEEDIPVRGNVCDTGDEELDKKMEAEVLNQLQRGNLWAWCTVRVVASFDGETGDDYLGCCSYKNEEEFKHGDGYYPQMQEEALHRLIANLNARELRHHWKTFEADDGTEETVPYAGVG